MAKGGRRDGAGRPKGIPNKSTDLARQSIAKFVDENSHKFQEWLDEIYAEHGAKEAFACVKDLIEYHVPKLSRSDDTMRHTGVRGEPVYIEVKEKKGLENHISDIVDD